MRANGDLLYCPLFSRHHEGVAGLGERTPVPARVGPPDETPIDGESERGYDTRREDANWDAVLALRRMVS